MRNKACNFWRFLLRGGHIGLLIALVFGGDRSCAGAEFNESHQAEFASHLNTHISAVWQGQSLSVVLDRLATAYGIVFWVDRRVDLQQSIEADFNNMPLDAVLDNLTEHSLGWSPVGSICYIGPREATREIVTLVEVANDSVAGLPTAKRKRWNSEGPTTWPRLSQPRLLLAEWLNAHGIELLHSELIQHDLWSAKELPPMPLVERIVLLLVGFDLTCQITPNSGKCMVVPIERPVVITRKYEAGTKSRAAITQMSRQVPEFQVVRQGEGLTATGRWEDHVRFSAMLAGNQAAQQSRQTVQTGRKKQLFSLKLENQPFGKVMAAISRQMQLEIVWDESLLDSPADPRGRLVSCETVDADLPTLLESLTEPIGVSYRLQNGKLLLTIPSE